MKIDELELTVRSHNGLSNAGITTVEQLLDLDWKRLRNIKDVGKKSISEIVWACVHELRKDWPDALLTDFELAERNEKASKYDEFVKIISNRPASPTS